MVPFFYGKRWTNENRKQCPAGGRTILHFSSPEICFCLGIYNLCGWTADGDSVGEQAAHYFEFCFGAASSVVTFWFTMDNKISAEKRLRQIIYK